MQLRPYQLEGIEKIKELDCVGIFSQQRTGKTPMAIMGLWNKGIRRPVIVCPASLVYNWQYEYERWTGSKATVVERTSYNIPKEWTEGALIINYEKLRDTKNTEGMWKDILRAKPEAVILDEAHRIKTRPTRSIKAYTTKACMKLKVIPIRLVLTGTPAPNHPSEVFNLLNFLYPETYSSYWRWTDRMFTQEKIYVFGQVHNKPSTFKPGMDILFQRELDKIAIQHKRKDVMSWSEDEIEPTVIKLPATTYQQKYIKELETYFRAEDVITQGVLDNLIRIRQVCSAPAILNLKGKSPKLEWLKQYIKDNPESSLLVFSNSTKLLELAYKDLNQPSVGIISGKVSAYDRSVLVKDFQADKIKVLLIQTQAGKEGLTLDQADGTIFLDTFPPAADYQQAKDRMVSTSPDKVKPKELFHIMIADTYDERLYDLVASNVVSTAVVNDYIDYIKRRN